MTYKMGPDAKTTVSFDGTYGAETAQNVIVASMDDYAEHFSSLSS